MNGNKISVNNAIEWFEEYWREVILGIVIIFIILIIGFSLYRSARQPKEGTVIRKDYYPEYTSTEYNYITQADGKRIRVPTQKYHAARYQITIKGINAKGKEDFGCYDVTPAEYEKIEIGNYYIRQKGGIREE